MLLNIFHVILNNIVVTLCFGVVDQNCIVTLKKPKIQFNTFFYISPYKLQYELEFNSLMRIKKKRF